ncbi:hypothetical protein [Pseudomonas putida]|uniref:hypothetical protein n=1 Tax=Pseudomonas putida TaxID=303 RepID=UPI000D3B8AD3|nr:hypothetical protein [Pseudomonas putida]PTV59132.1 hypothetical protein DBL03_16770 [Pseudomonas putida]
MKKRLPQWLLAVVLTALLIAISLLTLFVIKFGYAPSDSQESWGQFGDFVGGILNPLFSIIGLFALLHTIVLQSKELSKSTKELKASAKALKRQNKHNARQQFDNNFFQLLTLNLSLISSVHLRGKVSGEAAFQSAVDLFLYGFDANNADFDAWVKRFDEWRSDPAYVFDTYIHSLSNVINFVINSRVSKGAKETAFITISSNLSSGILIVLFLFCTFSSEHNWLRVELENSGFFGWCQLNELNYIPIWKDIPPFSRVDLSWVLDSGTQEQMTEKA